MGFIDVFCCVYISCPGVPGGLSECPPAERGSCGVDPARILY